MIMTSSGHWYCYYYSDLIDQRYKQYAAGDSDNNYDKNNNNYN